MTADDYLAYVTADLARKGPLARVWAWFWSPPTTIKVKGVRMDSARIKELVSMR